MDRSTGRTTEDEDAPSSEQPNPRQAALLAESQAISPYLMTWLLSGRAGQFTVTREDSGMLSVAAEVYGAPEVNLIPWPAPPGN